MSHDAARPSNDPVTVSIRPGNDQGPTCGQNRRRRSDEGRRPSDVRSLVAQASPRRATAVVRSLLCAVVLGGVGCGWGQTGPREYTEEEAQAQTDELLARFPVPPPDTPEQIQEKEAKVAEALPQVYELLEEGDTDPTKIDEAVE